MGLKPEAPVRQQVRLARRLMDGGYEAPLSLEAISREVALSPFYLIRAFRQVYRQTPHQYLVGQRIAKAKDLLRYSDLSITEICVAVGYASLGSFSALFRKEVGVSPSVYRASSRPTPHPAYIPLCVCMQHGLTDDVELERGGGS